MSSLGSRSANRKRSVAVTLAERASSEKKADAYHITANSHVDEVSQSLFGRTMPHHELARLAGAQEGERVRLAGDTQRQHINMHVQGDHHTADRYIAKDAHGHLYIGNQEMQVDDGYQGRGTARDALRTQIAVARQHGITYIASGGARQDEAGVVGYKVLPRLGFDAPIPAHMRDELPSSLRHAHTLQDLYATSEGESWWAEHGDSLDMRYDIT